MLTVPPTGPELDQMVDALSRFESDEEVDAALLELYNSNRAAIQTDPDGKTFREAIDWIVRQSGHHQHAIRFVSLYSKYQSKQARKGPVLLILIEELWKAARAEAKARALPEPAPVTPPIIDVRTDGFFRRLFR
jgi:hypothetical protein